MSTGTVSDRLEVVASRLAPPFGEIETAIFAAIELADELDGDTDIEWECPEPDFREMPKL